MFVVQASANDQLQLVLDASEHGASGPSLARNEPAASSTTSAIMGTGVLQAEDEPSEGSDESFVAFRFGAGYPVKAQVDGQR